MPDDAWKSQGFAAIPRWLLHDPQVSAHAKLTYLGLATYMNRQGLALVKRSTLAATVGLSVRTVSRALNDLETLGAIERSSRFVDGQQRASVYRVLTAVDGAGEDTPEEH